MKDVLLISLLFAVFIAGRSTLDSIESYALSLLKQRRRHAALLVWLACWAAMFAMLYVVWIISRLLD
jgi:hypothetical protein